MRRLRREGTDHDAEAYFVLPVIISQLRAHDVRRKGGAYLDYPQARGAWRHRCVLRKAKICREAKNNEHQQQHDCLAVHFDGMTQGPLDDWRGVLGI